MSSSKRMDLILKLVWEVKMFIASAILYNEHVAASLGLNGTDLQILHLLELRVASTPGDLARLSGLTTGGVTVVLDRLEKHGYIKRLPNPADRRSVLVQTVPAKLRKLAPLYQSKGEALMKAVAEYEERDLRAVIDFFKAANSSESAARKRPDPA